MNGILQLFSAVSLSHGLLKFFKPSYKSASIHSVLYVYLLYQNLYRTHPFLHPSKLDNNIVSAQKTYSM